MEPKVSIIVPVYNVEQYLPKCIESILNQTYRNLEIILVNDGSTDSSGSICDEYASKDPRIKVLQQKNSGVSAARNYGLEIADGEYIGFVDSDDWLDDDMYSSLVDLAESNQADLAICGYYVNNDIDPSIKKEKAPERLTQEMAIVKCLDIDYFSLGTSLWNKLFKSSLIKGHKLKLDESLVIGEDMLFVCQFILEAETIIHSPQPKYHYAINDTGAINMKFHSKKASVIDAHRKLEELIHNQYPQLDVVVRKRSAINSYNLLRQAMGSSYSDTAVIQRFQEDIAREYQYVFSRIGRSLKERIIFLLITKYPGIYRSFRSVVKN